MRAILLKLEGYRRQRARWLIDVDNVDGDQCRGSGPGALIIMELESSHGDADDVPSRVQRLTGTLTRHGVWSQMSLHENFDVARDVLLHAFKVQRLQHSELPTG